MNKYIQAILLSIGIFTIITTYYTIALSLAIIIAIISGVVLTILGILAHGPANIFKKEK